MSRASEFRPEFGRSEFGLLAAGPVARSLVGRMHSRGSAIGPVAAVSLRVASRIANSIGAGFAVRSLDELENTRGILFYSSAEHGPVLLEMLAAANISWTGKSLIFCEAEIAPVVLDCYRSRGAAVAAIRRLGSVHTAMVESDSAALPTVRRIALDAGLQTFEIPAGGGELFAAALTLCGAGLTPLIDRAAMLFRLAGLRDIDASRLAAGMVNQTATEYAHSGKQSWAWHVRPPDPERIAAALAAVPPEHQALLQALVLAGFLDSGKHSGVAAKLKSLMEKQGARPAPAKKK
jgi:hypothetical protein